MEEWKLSMYIELKLQAAPETCLARRLMHVISILYVGIVTLINDGITCFS